MLIPIIIGPTASGKSQLAVDLAKKIHGGIVNADTMQMYSDFRLLSARPSLLDELTVPHCLYGFLSYKAIYNVYLYTQTVFYTLLSLMYKGIHPIIVGGTGFYIQNLIEGISIIPSIPSYFRKKIDYMYHDWDLSDIQLALDKNHALDYRRLARRLEVLKYTGFSLDSYKDRLSLPFQWLIIYINKNSSDLLEKVKLRLEHALSYGLMEEIKSFVNTHRNFQDKKYSLLYKKKIRYPIQRILGVDHFLQVYWNLMSVDEALDKTYQDTKHYIKRQKTWFKNKVHYDYVMADTKDSLVIDLILCKILDYDKHK